MHGHAQIEDFVTGIAYVGDIRNGEITGQGKYTYQDGSEYEGTFLKGRFHGDGQFTL